LAILAPGSYKDAMSNNHADSSLRAIFFAFSANLGIAVAKTAAAIFTSSGSMLAEAIHSFADCGNQVLLWVGLRQAVKPPDAEHPLGYGKLSYFWSFMVAILLFALGGLFSIYEGWHKLHAPGALNAPWVALGVLAVSIGLETVSLLGCLREVRRLRGTQTFTDWLAGTRNAELVVVLGEDCAALAGLAIAFAFLSAAAVTGNMAFDAAGSIAIGIVLVIVAVFVAHRIKGLLIGRSAEPALQRRIDALIAADPTILRTFNVITVQYGPQVLLAAKVQMRSGIDIDTAVRHINALEKDLKRAMPEIGWCFIEPDNED
jgi:cation diffusion facilitator family transporter